jgi:signal transduction histidine kinase
MTLTGDDPWFSASYLRWVLGKLPGGLALVNRQGDFVEVAPTAAAAAMASRRQQSVTQLFPGAIADLCLRAIAYVLEHHLPITQSFPEQWLTVQFLPFSADLILWHEQNLSQDQSLNGMDLELTQQLVGELDGRKQVTALLVEHLERVERISAMVAQLNQANSLPEIYGIAAVGIRRVLQSSFAALFSCDRPGHVHLESSHGLNAISHALVQTILPPWGDRPPYQPRHYQTSGYSLSLFPLHTAEPGWANPVGLLIVGYQAPHPLVKAERHTAETLSTYVAIAIGRQQIAESLRRREWELAEAHRIAHLGKWEWDLQTQEVTASPEFALLLGEPRLPLRLPLTELIQRVPPEYQSQWQQLPQKLQEPGAIAELEHPMHHRGGDLRLFYSKCQRFTGENATPMKICGITQDVTQQRQAEAIRLQLAQEQELNQLQVRFFSMVSHEFRTPLGVITNSVHLLKLYSQRLEGDTGTPLQRHIQHIDNSARILTGLLEEILTLNRAEVGQLEVRRDLICLPEFCRLTLDDISKLHRHAVFLVNQLHESNTWIETDARLLRCLLTNLLDPLYGDPASPTTITLQQTPEHLTIQVCHPLSSADPNQALRKVELGLGLTAARRFADPLRGVITCLHNTYTVCLPLDIVVEPTLP